MAGYAKLWSGITESTLWDESKEARLLFVSMLARADSTGFVESGGPGGLARMANLTADEVIIALEVLTSPDLDSKSKVAEGRRIVKVPRGYAIVNYEEYRARRDDEERRDYMRNYMREYRSSQPQNPDDSVNSCKDTVNESKSRKPPLAKAEAEAEKEKEKEKESPPTEKCLINPGTTFLCADDSEYRVPFSLLESLDDDYPQLDAVLTIKDACAWVRSSPKNRKTVRGMPTFLRSWFRRANADLSVNENKPGRPLELTDLPQSLIDQVNRDAEKLEAEEIERKAMGI